MALVPCIIPFQPSWFPLQITQRCRWDAWSLCVIVVPQQAYETFHLLPRAPADSLGPAWPSDKHSPEVQVNLPGSPPLMGECQLPVLCLDNSGGPSQFEPLSLPVAPSVMGPHIVLFSSPISFSPLLPLLSGITRRISCHPRFCLQGVGRYSGQLAFTVSVYSCSSEVYVLFQTLLFEIFSLSSFQQFS